jgi:serine/threonine protein kinase
MENYKILSHIGKGSFSIVSLAINKITNERCAIKTYNKVDKLESYKF